MESEATPKAPPPSALKEGLRRRIALVLIPGFVLWGLGVYHRRPDPAPYTPELSPPRANEEQAIRIPLPTPLPPWPAFTHPTPQRNWAAVDDPEVYMPTGSGRVESAAYGSVRTNSSGRASFHEGVDIAPTAWSRGRAMDPIFAAADGKIVYINRVAGNSSYGIYVVIEHTDDAGPVYTVYAHLGDIAEGVRTGQRVKGGEEIARMGNTSTLGIPLQRSHLHFEMGMMLNPRFDRWYRAKKMIPDHGLYHGFNLVGFDPLLMLEPLSGKESTPFSYLYALRNLEPAWELLLRSDGRPRYFDQYPKLWEGEPYHGKAMLLRISESGIPLSGRNATATELAGLGSSRFKIPRVNEEALGRNGLRHVVKSGGSWTLGNNGTRWLEILLYHAH